MQGWASLTNGEEEVRGRLFQLALSYFPCVDEAKIIESDAHTEFFRLLIVYALEKPIEFIL